MIRRLFVFAILLSMVFGVTFGPVNGLRNSLIKVDIPDSYYQLYNYTDNSSSRLLFLPPNWVVQTNWAPYAQDGIFAIAVWDYKPVPYIGPTIQEMSLDRSIEYDSYMIEQLRTTGLNAMPLLTRAGVGYIALMKDLQSTSIAPYNASDLKNLNSQLSGLQKILDDPHLTLYKIPENITVPNVYGTTSLIYAYPNVTHDDMLEIANGDLKTPIYFSGDNPSMDTLLLNMSSVTVISKTPAAESLAISQNVSSQSSFDIYNNSVRDIGGIQPKVSYFRPDASTVSVQVNEASQPFFLIFSDSYDPSWVATIDTTALPHFIANGYANGWYVNQTGSFKIELRYIPQSISDFGTLTGILGIIIVATTYIALNRRFILRLRHKISYLAKRVRV